MKSSPLFRLIALAVATIARAEVPAPAPLADADWQAYQDVGKSQPPKPAKEMSRLEIAKWVEQAALNRRELGLAFIDKHPADPRRWEIVYGLSPASPRFVKEWGPLDDKGVPSKPVIDEAAAAAWKARVAELKAAMEQATDVPNYLRRLTAEHTEPKPQVYDPKADTPQQIREAEARAKAEGKHVLLQIGGQWCIWCMRLHKLMTSDPELQRLTTENFVLVHVNWSPENKNENVLAELGHPERFGFPVMVVLDGNGQRLHTQDLYLLTEGDGLARGISAYRVGKFLRDWSAKAVNPETHAKNS